VLLFKISPLSLQPIQGVAGREDFSSFHQYKQVYSPVAVPPEQQQLLLSKGANGWPVPFMGEAEGEFF
jgi:hypothetical protein